jgi:GntR family transcriptional regulator/MocR family aminotransferase
MQDFQSNILLNLHGPGPVHERLAHALRAAIRDGRLPPGSGLPATRVLARDIGRSRWVVTEAYAQLAAEGYVEGRVGSGTRVRAVASSGGGPAEGPPAQVPRNEIDMAPGLPDLRAFPVGRWAAAVRQAVTALPATDFGYPDPAGHPALRGLLGDYLARVRGADTGAAAVTVCRGATDGLGRICRALRLAGCTAIAVEDPGWHRIAAVVSAAGLAVRPVPVDAEGIEVDRLRDIGAVVVTPAHQFPAGVVLSARRRAALLAWARRSGGLVIEDDYDAEFRYDRKPVGVLQGNDPSRVVLVGSLSKTLSPALGIGWLVTPPAWTAEIRGAVTGDMPPPVLDQLAFTAFLRAGWYDRHLRSMRRRYHERRDVLVGELARRIPGAMVSGVAAGMHLVLELPDGTDPAAIRSATRARGVRVVALDAYRAEGSGPPGLVLGYGNLADQQVVTGVAALADAMADCCPQRGAPLGWSRADSVRPCVGRHEDMSGTAVRRLIRRDWRAGQ